MWSKLIVVTLLIASYGAYTVNECSLKEGGTGYCVQSYQCRSGRIVTNGDDLLDERSLDCRVPKVCCALVDDDKLTTTTPMTRTLVPGVRTPPSAPGGSCTAFDQSPGRCLYPHLCRNDSTATDGSDLVDERSIDPCPNWRGAIQICCPESYLPPDFDFDEPTTESTRNGGQDKRDISCPLSSGKHGVCAPFYQCIDEDDSTDGSNIINVRTFEEAVCPYTTKCCPSEFVDRSKKPVTPPPSKECGMPNEHGLVYQIFDGRPNEAKFGEYPWMVAVRCRNENGGYNMSGGTLIHPSVVLTAAHYVLRAVNQEVRVRAGEWDIETTTEPLPYQEIAVRKIVSHPEFNNRNKHNDIALLFTECPFVLKAHVGVACLPPPTRAASTTDCVANGWGKNKFGSGGKLQQIMKKTALPVVDRADCQSRLRTTRLGPFYRLHQGFMCAGGLHLDTCTQDGGGPLACPVEEGSKRMAVWGIVSWGIGCGEDGLPGVYVDVSQYRTWLLVEAVREAIDLSEYVAKS